MDFKSHSEFVLPPHKGVKRKKGKEPPEPAAPPRGLPQPREYRRRASESKLVNDPDLERSSPTGARRAEPSNRPGSPEADTASMADAETASISEAEAASMTEADTETIPGLESTATSGAESEPIPDLETTVLSDAVVESLFAPIEETRLPDAGLEQEASAAALPPTLVVDDVADGDAWPGAITTREILGSRDETEEEAVDSEQALERVLGEKALKDAEGSTDRIDVSSLSSPADDAAAPESARARGAPVVAAGEPESSRIVEDESIIRAISSVVEKLDRMEGQLKQGSEPVPTSQPATAAKTTPSSDHREFIIAYEGDFVGHFRTGKRISNKKAFQKAAAVVREKIFDFDPRRLQLYRPVLVKIENPESIPYVDGESFSWFAGSPGRAEA